jgi:hypothetical protein
MTPEATSRLVHRLGEKFAELEAQLTLDADKAIDQFEEHRDDLRKALRGLPEHPDSLKAELADEAHNLKQKLDDLDVQLSLARMETEDASRRPRMNLGSSTIRISRKRSGDSRTNWGRCTCISPSGRRTPGKNWPA